MCKTQEKPRRPVYTTSSSSHHRYRTARNSRIVDATNDTSDTTNCLSRRLNRRFFFSQERDDDGEEEVIDLSVPSEAEMVKATPANAGTTNSTRIDTCLLYTSDAADEEDSVDLGGRRIIKKKKKV
eukprot:TRINITY_DN36821_c0_g1_i2.p1 TRINITY_DN36821_c0_g1~~TRINITY_DN36821_c0_g1_i2.p1  ORF type:complete len:126 (-),score=25.25 TRINITY_DN36821_c0_g1_i2:116-493(-)